MWGWDWASGYLTALRHVARMTDWINPTSLQILAACLSALAGLMAWRVSARVATQGDWDRLFRAQNSARSAALQLHQRAALVAEELQPFFAQVEQQHLLGRASISEYQLHQVRKRVGELRGRYTQSATTFMQDINSSRNAFEIEASKGEIDLAIAELEFSIVEVRRKLTIEVAHPSAFPARRESTSL